MEVAVSFDELTNTFDEIEDLYSEDVENVVERYESGRIRYNAEYRRKVATSTISGLKLRIMCVLSTRHLSDDSLASMDVFDLYRPSTVSKRRTELVQMGLVEEADKYSPYGWPMRKWKLTKLGEEAIFWLRDNMMEEVKTLSQKSRGDKGILMETVLRGIHIVN